MELSVHLAPWTMINRSHFPNCLFSYCTRQEQPLSSSSRWIKSQRNSYAQINKKVISKALATLSYFIEAK